MIISEYKHVGATVRIHDDFIEKETEQCIARLSHIVSAAYKRRRLDQGAASMAIAQEKSGMTSS